MRTFKLLSLLLIFHVLDCDAQVDTLPLNRLRTLASHNSYKNKPNPKVQKFLNGIKDKLGEENDPIQLEYAHERLTVQLDSFKVRGFELDVYADPKGGKYYKRRVNGFVRGMKKRSKVEELKAPGFKIIHIVDIDYETNYFTFKSALEELVQWSSSNPDHLPLFINIEAKGNAMGDESGLLRFFGFQKAIKYDSCIFQLLNEELMSTVPEDILLKPRELLNDQKTLRDRIDHYGWPTVSEVRGKMFFILEGNNSGWYAQKLEEGSDYPMFVYGDVKDEMTLFIKRNDPLQNENEIQKLTEDFIVRTRSDAGTIEARSNDQSRKQAAIESGAQIVSTDYYKPDPEMSDFMIAVHEIPGAY